MVTEPDPEKVTGLLDLPSLIRYTYSGFLAVGLTQLTDFASKVRELLAQLGTVAALAAVFFSGVLIWALYHQILGEFLWFRIVHRLHRHVWPATSDTKLLEDLGVPRSQIRVAYELVRHMYFPPESRKWVELAHAHNQILHLTGVMTVIFIPAVRYSTGEWPYWWQPLLVIGGALLLFDLLVDIRQHSIERTLMLTKGQDLLTQFLDDHGLIPTSNDALHRTGGSRCSPSGR